MAPHTVELYRYWNHTLPTNLYPKMDRTIHELEQRYVSLRREYDALLLDRDLCKGIDCFSSILNDYYLFSSYFCVLIENLTTLQQTMRSLSHSEVDRERIILQLSSDVQQVPDILKIESIL